MKKIFFTIIFLLSGSALAFLQKVPYAVMTGDRWKVTNTIYSVFEIPPPSPASGSDVFDYSDPYASFHALIGKLVTSQKTSMGGACDVNELTFKPWDFASPLYGLFRLENFYATSCKGEGELSVKRYILGGGRYGFMKQFCDRAFGMPEVVEQFKSAYSSKASDNGLDNSEWNSEHTAFLYKKFYPNYKVDVSDLEDLNKEVCEGDRTCDFDEGFAFLSFALCFDPGWIDE